MDECTWASVEIVLTNRTLDEAILSLENAKSYIESVNGKHIRIGFSDDGYDEDEPKLVVIFRRALNEEELLTT
jgi:hypothetical protein